MTRNFQPYFKRVLAICISLITALMLAEVALRAFNYRPGTMDPAMYVRYDNELLPYKLQGNYEGYCAGKEVTTDIKGYRRVRPTYEELNRGKSVTPSRDVLLVGDSGVFGFGVSDTETIASQMQVLSASKNLNYKISNIGVSGYTSWNEFAALQDYLRTNTPTDIILLYMPNDLTFDNDYFGIGEGNIASFSKNENRTHRLTRLLYSSVYVSYLMSDSVKRIAGALSNKKELVKFDENLDQPKIDYSMKALTKIRDACQANKIFFAVAIYRDVAYYDDSSGWLKYENAIQRNLDRNGIRWFIAKSHIENLSVNEVKVSWGDPHPGSKACGLIAREILQYLQST